MSKTRYKQVAKMLFWRGTDFWPPHFARLGLRDFGSGFAFGCLAAWIRFRFGCCFCCGPGWFPLRVQKTSSRYGQNGSRYSPHPYINKVSMSLPFSFSYDSPEFELFRPPPALYPVQPCISPVLYGITQTPDLCRSFHAL